MALIALRSSWTDDPRIARIAASATRLPAMPATFADFSSSSLAFAASSDTSADRACSSSPEYFAGPATAESAFA